MNSCTSLARSRRPGTLRRFDAAGHLIRRQSGREVGAVAVAGMGGGVKQRDLVKMTPDEVEQFIHHRRTMSMCTLNHDGSIHAVAMWYGFLEGAVAVETKAKSQKAQNLRRDPTMTCLFEAGDSYETLQGVELVGRGEIVEEPERIWELGVSVFERYQGPYTEELRPFVEVMLHKRIVVKLHVDRVVSWDHHKLGMAPGASGASAGS